jgi:hypothetical protein
MNNNDIDLDLEFLEDEKQVPGTKSLSETKATVNSFDDELADLDIETPTKPVAETISFDDSSTEENIENGSTQSS